jgi:hypothetical protein
MARRQRTTCYQRKANHQTPTTVLRCFVCADHCDTRCSGCQKPICLRHNAAPSYLFKLYCGNCRSLQIQQNRPQKRPQTTKVYLFWRKHNDHINKEKYLIYCTTSILSVTGSLDLYKSVLERKTSDTKHIIRGHQTHRSP